MAELHTRIAAYLEYHQGATRDAARTAARAIADAWNDREFWLAPTLAPLEKAALASPDWTTPARDVVDQLALGFDVHVHDCPAYTPHATTKWINGRYARKNDERYTSR
jgi:hypothetical protein